jgi:ribosome maturation factor RimP
MDDAKKQILAEVERIAHDVATGFGLEIVEFVFHSQGRHSLLRIDIDRPGVPGVGLADCENLSRALGERIEDLTFFDAPYELQVSSPGIDRPIRTVDDVRRNDGRPVWMEFRDEDGKIRELRGTLSGPHGADALSTSSTRRSGYPATASCS